jgi:hypothetical protein
MLTGRYLTRPTFHALMQIARRGSFVSLPQRTGAATQDMAGSIVHMSAATYSLR